MTEPRETAQGWYCVGTSGGQEGPMSLTELARLLASRPNAANILVWHAGMANWARAGEVPELKEFLKAPPALFAVSPRDRAIAETFGPRDGTDGSQIIDNEALPAVYPWRRFFARLFDLYAFILVLAVVLGVAFPELFEDLGSSRGMDLVYNIVGLAAFAVFEGFCQNIFGGTPGKSLFGMHVRSNDGNKLGLSVSFKRSFLVWLKGWGLGIPIVGLVTLIVGYTTLTNKGQTSWDRDLHCMVVTRELSTIRWIMIVVASVVLVSVWIGLIALGASS
jgi:uncharacterized RDD family membrane protein YckC